MKDANHLVRDVRRSQSRPRPSSTLVCANCGNCNSGMLQNPNPVPHRWTSGHTRARLVSGPFSRTWLAAVGGFGVFGVCSRSKLALFMRKGWKSWNRRDHRNRQYSCGFHACCWKHGRIAKAAGWVSHPRNRCSKVQRHLTRAKSQLRFAPARCTVY